MTWAEGDTWTYDATVLEDTTVEYKYVRRSAGEVVWEEGGNRVLPVDTSKMASVAIKDLWEHQELSEVAVTAAGEPAAEAEAEPSAPEGVCTCWTCPPACIPTAVHSPLSVHGSALAKRTPCCRHAHVWFQELPVRLSVLPLCAACHVLRGA
jgi:hypothetical protein